MSDTWIVGINPVAGIIESDPARVRELRVEQGSRNRRVADILKQAQHAGIRVRHASRAELDDVAGHGVRHQGIAAACEVRAAITEDDLPDMVADAGSDALFLVLDGVTDPHNLGACLRSAAAAGVTAVIVPKDGAAGVTPTVRRASAGGAERVPLVVVTNLARAMRTLKDSGVWLTGLAGEAEQSIHDVDFRGAVAIVMGSEGDGMRRLTRETCDFLARIPMPGNMESLNVSVATGIALFEAIRQRSQA